jgi:flagellar hook assembly protein FlgD
VPPVATGAADTEIISPNGDGRLDEMNLDVTFSEPTSWAFELSDGEQVLDSKEGNGSTLRLAFDGTVEGVALDEGRYVWTLTGSDEAGNEMDALQAPIEIDRTAPVVKNLRMKGRRNRRALVAFEITEPGTLIVKFARRGRVVRRLTKTVDAGGPVWFRWDGTNKRGKPARRGRYRVVIKAYDLAFNRTVMRPGRVVLKK